MSTKRKCLTNFWHSFRKVQRHGFLDVQKPSFRKHWRLYFLLSLIPTGCVCIKQKNTENQWVLDVSSFGRCANQQSVDCQLDRANVFGAWAFGAAACFKGNLLAFSQCFEIDAFHGRVVEEHVGSGAVFDETKSFVSNSLNRSFSHSGVPMLSKNCAAVDARNIHATWTTRGFIVIADAEPFRAVFGTSLSGVSRRVRRVLLELAQRGRLMNSRRPNLFRPLRLPFVSGGEHAYPQPWSSFPSLADAWRMYSDSLRWDFSLDIDGAQ